MKTIKEFFDLFYTSILIVLFFISITIFINGQFSYETEKIISENNAKKNEIINKGLEKKNKEILLLKEKIKNKLKDKEFEKILDQTIKKKELLVNTTKRINLLKNSLNDDLKLPNYGNGDYSLLFKSPTGFKKVNVLKSSIKDVYKTMEDGAALIEISDDTNMIIGHSSGPNRELEDIESLKLNGYIYLVKNSGGLKEKFLIREREIVEPNEVGKLNNKLDIPVLKIVTCYPPGTSNKRLILTVTKTQPEQIEI